MGNAREELKEKATFISTKNTENGIVNGLKNLIYYKRKLPSSIDVL